MRTKILIVKFKLLLKLILVLFVISCNTKTHIEQKLIGKKFITKTEKRELILEIIDDKNLKITNEFKCQNLPENYKTKTFFKEYNISNDKKIILKDSVFEFKLPYFDNSDCEFLSELFCPPKFNHN